MKLNIFLLGSNGSRSLVWSDEDYRPGVKGGASALLNEAVRLALTTVISTYFNGVFGISYSPIIASAGVLRQRIRCSGRNVRLEANDNGIMMPIEDNSSPDREFDVELRLDAASLKLKPLTDIQLRKILISNLRSIKSLEIDFKNKARLFLVAGLNGSGKTSVLEAIAHAFVKRDIMSEIRPLPDEDYNITIDFVDSENNSYTVQKTKQLHVLKDVEGLVIADTDYELRRYFADINILMFTSWRSPFKMSRPTVASRTRNQRDAIEILRAVCIKEFINAVLKPKDTTKRYLNTLNKAWRRFYPEDDSIFEVAEDTGSERKDIPWELTFDLLLKGRNKSKYISLTELSAGELELLSFISDLMIKKSDITLIDEPELHLNRVWHKTVLNVVVDITPRCQFIVATHAPEIWESVYSWDKVFLSDGGVSHA